MPILTTTAGIRGYLWKEGSLPIKDTPELFAQSVIEKSDPAFSKNIKDEVSMVNNPSPDMDVITSLIKVTLNTEL